MNPPEYLCAEGAIQDEGGNFCPEFDICSDPTVKYNYIYRDTDPESGSMDGRCPNYPWCEENFRFSATEQEMCPQFDPCAEGGDGG